MRQYIHYLLSVVAIAVAAVCVSSCGEDFQPDIDRLSAQHDDVARRVTSIEAQVNSLNTQLGDLAGLSTAVEQGLYVTAVATTAEGYELTLSNGTVLVLHNRPDNTIGLAPALGMTQLGGLYYWSLSGTLLTGTDGNPIRTTDLTPIIKYDDTTHQWLISIDGGTTFSDVNTIVSVVFNDRALIEIINHYVRQNSTVLFNQQALYQIISTYIQRNYAQVFNVQLLDEVVAGYIRKHYTRLFNYELLEQIFTQYDFEYYTSQIRVEQLSELIVNFIQEHREIFTDNEVLYEIVANYIEVNKTDIFSTQMLLEIITDFVNNNANLIDIDLLTHVIHDYIDHHRDVIFDTEVVRQMMAEYLRRYYVRIFSQDILVQALNLYVQQNDTVIFNPTLIREIIDEYVQRNHTTIFSRDILEQIVRTYVEQNASTIFNREVLVEVITNYFSRNYNLFIDRTVITQIVNDYIERHHDTLISVDIIEAVVTRYLSEYYTEVFSEDFIHQIFVEYFDEHTEVIREVIRENADPIRDVSVDGDLCTVTMADGTTVSLVVYDAYARLRDRVQSISAMVGASGRFKEEKDTYGEGSLINLRYLVAPAAMARVIADKYNSHELTLELKATDTEGNLSTQDIYGKVYADDQGVLSVDLITQTYGRAKTIALHVKENKIGSTDIMTEFTPIGEIAGKGYLTCPDNHHPHMIDLGLPSGTLWACCNVGAEEPGANGNYYAWGEIQTKKEYSWQTYLYLDKKLPLDIAGSNYDVVSTDWGGDWQMPTRDQMQELVDNCSKTPYARVDLGGGGYTFVGSNGGKISMPSAGYKLASELITGFMYWSSSAISSYDGNHGFLLIKEDEHFSVRSYPGYWGMTIRPVAASSATPSQPSLSLSEYSLHVTLGETATVKIISGSGSYTVSSSNTSIATASLSGSAITIKSQHEGSVTVTVTDTQTQQTASVEVVVKAYAVALTLSTYSLFLTVGEKGTVTITSGSGSYQISYTSGISISGSGSQIIVTAEKVGKANVIVKDKQTQQTKTVTVTVTSDGGQAPGQAVDLGLPSGTKWASCNVGATKPEEYGDYYAWGETEAKSVYDWSTYKWCNGTEKTQTKYCTSSAYGKVDNKKVLDASDDVAHVKWGGNWRMPTDDEIKELVDKCSNMWTTVNGVNGRKFTGPNGNSIFLPAAGVKNGSRLREEGTFGAFWSSTLSDKNNSNYACARSFYSDRTYYYDSFRSSGLSVRPVRSN